MFILLISLVFSLTGDSSGSLLGFNITSTNTPARICHGGLIQPTTLTRVNMPIHLDTFWYWKLCRNVSKERHMVVFNEEKNAVSLNTTEITSMIVNNSFNKKSTSWSLDTAKLQIVHGLPSLIYAQKEVKSILCDFK
ncbi:hypothetical protein QAD02_022046 [Eretmocerus hayati]|uniref:Uncharacterized protein n=1 Tax=Eretmocerus hayati TaxID=131215 RepID=A0ACC2PS70_9HYME|nr:hypothetical protein QAD02_022046 [Eretmocerus hayati]